MKKTMVVIAAGGFAGLSAAMYLDKTLARRSDAEVTLVSSENFILFTPIPFRPESEKKVIDLLRSIWRRGESTTRINSKAVPGKSHTRARAAIGSNNKLERMKTINSSSTSLPVANVHSSLRRRDSIPLSEAIPFWFAISSPLIGLVLGFLGAWSVTWLTS